METIERENAALRARLILADRLADVAERFTKDVASWPKFGEIEIMATKDCPSSAVVTVKGRHVIMLLSALADYRIQGNKENTS